MWGEGGHGEARPRHVSEGATLEMDPPVPVAPAFATWIRDTAMGALPQFLTHKMINKIKCFLLSH